MRIPWKLKLWSLATGCILVVGGSAAVPGGSHSLSRLHSMPIERRLSLQGKLADFQELPPEDRARVRELDERLQRLDPQVRERYLEVLRRYEVWFRSLTPQRQQRVLSTPSSKRRDLLRELLPETTKRSETLDTVLSRLSHPSAPPILDQAYWIRVWLVLDPENQARLESASWPERQELLEGWGHDLGVRDERPEWDKSLQTEVLNRLNMDQSLQEVPGSKEPEAEARAVRRLLDAHILQSVEMRLPAPGEMDRFIGSLPGWMMAWVDYLPPEAARDRLRVLYHFAASPPDEVTSALDETPPRPLSAPTSSPSRESPVESNPF